MTHKEMCRPGSQWEKNLAAPMKHFTGKIFGLIIIKLYNLEDITSQKY